MSSELATVPHPTQSTSLSDVRSSMLSLPHEAIAGVLAEYSSRRKEFRDWLKEQLVEGVHYGFPPGCEPKYDDRGWVGVFSKGGMKYYPPEQWTAKPSFYKAGADFVCELMNVRDEYQADMAAWEQLGKPANTFVFTCRLISRVTAEVLGEGRGVRKVGQKGGDENNAIKMAKKSAKVDAVLNAYGLADLFTQDLEDAGSGKQPFEQPEQRADAAKAQPRGDRVTGANLKTLYRTYLTFFELEDSPAVRQGFREWQCPITGIPADACDRLENWTPLKLSECLGRLV